MPEGDTIHRTAAALRRALAGEIIGAARARVPGIDPEPLAGRRILDVRARGKNLLVAIEGDLVLHTHLGMTGSWHLYRPGEAWRKPERRARIVLETARVLAVCFGAPLVRLLSARAALRDRMLEGLGPDLLDPACDLEEARRRLRERGELAIGEALLVQRAVAGIGNVYKSEVLFLCGVDPWAKVAQLADGEIDRVLRTARDLMGRNLRGFPRVTREDRRGARHWVYRRAGLPCARCGMKIRVRRQGPAGRSTYFCPACQAAPEARRGSGGGWSSRP